MKDLTFAADPLAELPKSLKTHALRRMMRDWETLLASKTRKAVPLSLMAVSLAACGDDEKEEAQAALNEFIEDEDLSDDEAEELQDAFDEIVEELEDEDDSQDDGGSEDDEDEAAPLPVVGENQVLESSGPVEIELPEGAVVEEGENYVQIGDTLVLDTDAFDYLGVGEIYEQVIPYIGNGGLLSIKLEILGLNDAPEPVDVTGAAVENGPAIEVDLIPVDIDPDLIHYPGNLKVTDITDATGAASHDGRILTFDPDNGAFEYLAQGEVLDVDILFTVEDILGASGDGTATISVTGVNDAPVFQEDGEDKDVVEDDQVGTFDETGTLLFDDVDQSDTHQEGDGTSIVADGPVRSTDASISSVVEPSSPGEVNYTISYDNADLQDLAEGVTEIETYTVTVSDNFGATDTATVSVTLTGVNDAPEFVTDTDTRAITEDAGATFSEDGSFEFNDVDVGDTHQEIDGTAIASVGTTIGVGSITNVTEPSSPGSVDWNIFYDNADLQFLGAGETVVEEFVVTVSDNNGATDTGMVTVTLNGVNDDIENVDIPNTGTVNEDEAPVNSGNLREVGNVTFDDPDWSDTHTVDATFVSSTGPGGTEIGNMEALFDAEPVEGVGGAARWRYTVDPADVQFLAAGETVIETYDYTIDDGNGSSVTESVAITIEGENDAPEFALDNLDRTFSEDDAANVGGTVIRRTGNFDFEDVDLSDTHTFDIQPSGGGFLGTASILPATTDSTGTGSGEVFFGVDYVAADLQFLAAGETLLEVFNVTVDDGSATDLATVTVTVTGENDAPEFVLDNINRAISEDDTPNVAAGTVIRRTGKFDFEDVDLSDTHTFDIQPSGGGFIGTASILPATTDSTGTGAGEVFFAVDYVAADVQFLAAGETLQEIFNVTVDDGIATDLSTVTVTITGENDAPEANDDTGAVDDNAVLTVADDAPGDVLLNDTDPDTSDTLTVGAVEGAPGDVGTQITLASGALLTLNADGSYEYDPNGSFNFLALGATATDTFEYTVTDGTATDTATVTITVTGTNVAPEIEASNGAGTTHAARTFTEDESDPTIVKQGNVVFRDGDAGDTHTPALVGAAPTIGTITFPVNDPTDGAGEDGRFVVRNTVDNADLQYLSDGQTVEETITVSITDNDGASDTTDITYTYVGVNDDPTTGGATVSRTTNEDEDPTLISRSGDFPFADVDLADTHTVTTTYTGGGTALGTLVATATSPTLPDGSDGQIDWTYELDPALVQFLALGESLVETFDFTIMDSFGATDTRPFEITINGRNDDPTLNGPNPITRTTNEDELPGSPPNPSDDVDPTVVERFGTFTFQDDDLSNTHSVSSVTFTGASAQVGTLTATVVTQTSGVDGTGGEVDWAYELDAAAMADLQFLAQGESLVESFDITVEDNNGGTAIKTFEITINGRNDAPEAQDDYYYLNFNQGNALTLIENAPGVLDNDSDPDTSDSILVGAVNGNTGDVGATIDPGSGSSLTLNASGSFVLIEPNGRFQTDTFEYSVVDGAGASDTASVFVTDLVQRNNLDNGPAGGGDPDRPGDYVDPLTFDFFINPDLTSVDIDVTVTGDIDGGTGNSETFTVEIYDEGGALVDSGTFDGAGGTEATASFTIDTSAWTDDTMDELTVEVTFGSGVGTNSGNDLLVVEMTV